MVKNFFFTGLSSLIQIDSRVNDLVENVADEVHDHDQRRENDGGTHEQRIVAVGDAVNEVTADTGHGEDSLHDQRAGDDVRQHRTEIGDNGDEGVLERVPEDDLHARHALGLSGADIVLTQHVQHGGTGESGDIRGGVQRQRDDGQDQARRGFTVGRPSIWLQEKTKEEMIHQTAGCLSKELLYMKFLQGIPVVGAVGGAYDVVYLKQITEYANLKYERRFLERLGNKA